MTQYNFLLYVNSIYRKLIEKVQSKYRVIGLYNFKQLVDYIIESIDMLESNISEQIFTLHKIQKACAYNLLYICLM